MLKVIKGLATSTWSRVARGQSNAQPAETIVQTLPEGQWVVNNKGERSFVFNS